MNFSIVKQYNKKNKTIKMNHSKTVTKGKSYQLLSEFRHGLD